MKVGCVVMAAGHARRFGSNKLLEDLGGKLLISYVLEAVGKVGFDKVMAVACDDEVAAICESYHIPCIQYAGGEQSDSLRHGVQVMGDMDGCLFALGDQPLCSEGSMEKMILAFKMQQDHVIRLAFDDKPGSPVLFPKSYYPRLEALTGDQGGMAAVRGTNAKITLVQAASEAELWDADTASALARLQNYICTNRE